MREHSPKRTLTPALSRSREREKEAGGSAVKTLASVVMLFCISVATAQPVFVHLPDSLSGAVGETISVPISISGQVGRGVVSADITLGFREAVLSGTDLGRVGNATPSGWMFYCNPVPCSLLIALAGVDPLVAGDTLAVVKVVVNAADTTLVQFARCRLNEGGVTCSTQAGRFRGRLPGIEEGWSDQHESWMLRISPNPVRHTAEIAARIRSEGFTSLEIRDATGELVRTLFHGRASDLQIRARWDRRDDVGRAVPAGIYFCRLEALGLHVQQKLVLLE